MKLKKGDLVKITIELVGYNKGTIGVIVSSRPYFDKRFGENTWKMFIENRKGKQVFKRISQGSFEKLI